MKSQGHILIRKDRHSGGPLRTDFTQNGHELVEGLISVIMPAFNCHDLLAQSILSVIDQSYGNWELLIVDDGSSDATAAVAEEFAVRDPRIRVIPLGQNGGVANARNIGMQQARGQYLAFLDSDDLWLPHKLDTQVRFMQVRDAAFSFASYRRLLPDGTIGPMITVPERVDYSRLLKGNVIGCLTVMIDRAQVSPFTMLRGGHEDYIAWLTILRSGHLALGIAQDLARYRVSASSISGNKARAAGWTWKIYREIERMPLISAAYCFTCYSARSILSRIQEHIRNYHISPL